MTEEIKSRELPKGTTLHNGKYIIEKVLGVGGFGITYYAKHATLNQYYAIKEFFISGYCVRNTQTSKLHLQGITDEEYENYKRKFTEEAQTLTKLKHPNIVKVIDVFEENDTSYIVMPFVEGITLQKLVDKKGKLDYETSVNYVAQIAEAINHIHEQGILHRDVKPDNIMITPEYTAVLIDFGSAREFIHDKTQSHTSILTKGYAPLEQYSNVGKKGFYSDVYSLGAVFYFIVTGKKPLDAAARLLQEMKAPKTLASNLPDIANETILKAMALKPEERYQNVGELMVTLTGLKDWRVSAPGKKGTIPKKWIIAIIIGVAALLIGGLIWYFNRDESNKEDIVIKNEKRSMVRGRVNKLKVCLYKEHIYLQPTQGKLDTTMWYTTINDTILIEVSHSLPDNLDALLKMDSLPPKCSYYLYSGRMQKGYPDDTEGKADYHCGKDKSFYEGGFRKGLKSGNDCKRTFKDDGSTFTGSYRDDQPVFGEWRKNDKDSTMYRGTWRNERPDNGDRWKNGKLQGSYKNGIFERNR